MCDKYQIREHKYTWNDVNKWSKTKFKTMQKSSRQNAPHVDCFGEKVAPEQQSKTMRNYSQNRALKTWKMGSNKNTTKVNNTLCRGDRGRSKRRILRRPPAHQTSFKTLLSATSQSGLVQNARVPAAQCGSMCLRQSPHVALERVKQKEWKQLERETKRGHRGAKRDPKVSKGSQKGAKGSPKGAKGSPKGAEGSQKGAQREPKGDQNGAKNRSRSDVRTSSPKSHQNDLQNPPTFGSAC